MKQLPIKFLILTCVLLATTTVGAQTNLLLNGKADSKTEHWRAWDTTVEEYNGDKVFVLHKVGSLSQWTKLTEEAVSKFVLFIGRFSSERTNVDGKPTTNPSHFYIFFSNLGAKSEGPIILNDAKGENEWSTIYAIYQLPKESFIKCVIYGKKHDVPSEGSVVRFDNLGLYLFETEKDALEFAREYK